MTDIVLVPGEKGTRLRVNGDGTVDRLYDDGSVVRVADLMTITIPEEDRQLVLLALARLAAARPGFQFACLQAADGFGGIAAQEMFKEFLRLNADRWRPDET